MRTRNVPLATGVTLHCVDAGGGGLQGEPLVFLHGFPETHRAWRHQLAEFARDHRVVAPDQRGYGGSSRPDGVASYARELLMADVLALVDALGIERFTLVGHDWGGGLGWGLALAHPERISRLVILNAPHPWLFQRSLILDPAQRAASQYIRELRDRGCHARIQATGLPAFFESRFTGRPAARHIDAADRAAYLAEWADRDALRTMVQWYAASAVVVPAPDEEAHLPAWTLQAPRMVEVPTLVVWGLEDRSLRPVQLDGLDGLVRDLTVVRLQGVDHFVPWEAPEAVNTALREFLAREPMRGDPPP